MVGHVRRVVEGGGGGSSHIQPMYKPSHIMSVCPYLRWGTCGEWCTWRASWGAAASRSLAEPARANGSRKMWGQCECECKCASLEASRSLAERS